MTNEEKANAMVETVRKSVIPRYQDEDYKNNYFDEVKECCMIMAEWKDAQFAEQKQSLIDKACAWIDTYSQYRSDLIAKNLNEKFIDEFKKAMEEEK